MRVRVKGPPDCQVVRRCAAPTQLTGGGTSGSRIEFRGKVNIAVALGFATRDRAEQRNGLQARSPQLRLVRAQCLNYPLGRMHENSVHARKAVGIVSAAVSSRQIWQRRRCISQGLFPNRNVELVNFLAIVPDQALHNGCRNAGFVKERGSCPA